MVHSIAYYEEKYQYFRPGGHFDNRLEEIAKISDFGREIADKWGKLIYRILRKESYPVTHPFNQETFSLYVEFDEGVFEHAFDIDGATAMIKRDDLKPVIYKGADIIYAVDEGNINLDPARITPNHKNPVMVVQSMYFNNNKPHCINGNHRINEAFKNNEEVEVLSLAKWNSCHFSTTI